MTKPTSHAHNCFILEACKNFELKEGFVLVGGICPESLTKAGPKCPPAKVFVFHQGEEPTEICKMHNDVDPPGPAKCPIPYHKTGKLLIWTPTTLSSLAMGQTPEWPDAKRPDLYDAMVADGVNAERFASWVAPGDPLDPLTYNGFMSEEYWADALNRLDDLKDRDLTAIVTVSPYKAGITEAAAREVVRVFRQFLPNIVFECANEPSENWEQERILQILISEGIPLKHIMVAFHDSSEWSEMMKTVADLDDQGEIVKIKCLLSGHQFGSMETVNDTFFEGGNAMKILRWGNFVASCDGPDKLLKSLGLNFRYLEEREVDARRPNQAQLGDLVAYFIKNGAGYEMLSASAYRRPTVAGLSWPNMADAITIGEGERKTMSSAWMPGA